MFHNLFALNTQLFFSKLITLITVREILRYKRTAFIFAIRQKKINKKKTLKWSGIYKIDRVPFILTKITTHDTSTVTLVDSDEL